MFENLWQITMYGPVNNSNPPDHQEVQPDVEQKMGPLKDCEIQILEKVFGPLHPGMVIETTLQGILDLLPRNRRRTDAYASLVNKLKVEFDVDLKITSQKCKNHD